MLKYYVGTLNAPTLSSLRLWERFIVLSGNCATAELESSRTFNKIIKYLQHHYKKQKASLDFLLSLTNTSASCSFNIMSCSTGNGGMIASFHLDITIKEMQDLLNTKKIQIPKEIILVIHSSSQTTPFWWHWSKFKTCNQPSSSLW